MQNYTKTRILGLIIVAIIFMIISNKTVDVQEFKGVNDLLFISMEAINIYIIGAMLVLIVFDSIAKSEERGGELPHIFDFFIKFVFNIISLPVMILSILAVGTFLGMKF